MNLDNEMENYWIFEFGKSVFALFFIELFVSFAHTIYLMSQFTYNI
jgi:hypothetical protein